MAINWLLPVRGVQALFAIIALGLSGHIVASIDSYNVSISQFNFNVFESVFCLITLVYLVGILLVMQESAFAHPLFSLVIDGLNWIFWLAAFACVAAIINGASNTGEFGALVAFGVLEWLLFSVTLVFNLIAFLKGGKSGASGV